MNTLIIAEREAGIHGMLGDPRSPIEIPQPLPPVKYTLQTWDEVEPEAQAVAGPQSSVGTAATDSADRTKRRIIEFGAYCLANGIRFDVVNMQIVFIFHRSHRKVARTIIKAIRLLNGDAAWRALPNRYGRALRVKRVALLSCESGIEMNPADRVYTTFVHQSHDLRIASAAAFRLEKKPPPSVPPEYWDPFIYTFTTGDFLTGGTKLHPNRVSFVRCPNNQLEGQGADAHMGTKPGQPDIEQPSGGTIHKYEGANYVEGRDVPAGTEYDWLRNDW
jgi:hypothetical protein